MNTQTVTRRISLFLTLWLLTAILAGCSGLGRTIKPPTLPAPTSAPTEYWPTRDWRTSTPEAQGMDSQKLAQMLEAVKQQNLALHSLLVIRNGYIVSETYFQSYSQDRKHELYSCTKSFISTLVGLALDKGYLASVQRPVQDLLPGRSFENLDARKQAMTLENLLTMTSGLDWQEGDPIYRQMYMSGDWVKFVLDKPMSSQPGSQFNYCSGCSHVLSAIVRQATGVSTRDFAQKELFEPLGITSFYWEADSTGLTLGGWGLQITPRDMAKLGYLHLRQGKWAGRQIVSAEWVKAATQKHTGTDGALGYGYQWWTYPSFGAFTALGRYGQTIFVIPELDLVVVTTAALDNHDEIFRLIEKYIVPAAQKT